MRLPFYIYCLFSLTLLSFGQSEDLIERLERAQGTQKIEILHKIVIDLWLNYPEKAMGYGKRAFDLSSQLKDSALVSKSLRLIAGVYYYKGDYDSSLSYNTRALEIGLQLKDSTLINNGYNNIGLLYYNLGSYQIALEYLLRAKEIKEKRGETYGLSTTLNNIGLVFEQNAAYPDARKYFEMAYAVAVDISDIPGKLYSINNIGITYMREGKLGEANKFFRRGLRLAEEIENINWGAVSARGIGEVLMMKEEYDSVVFFLEKSRKASESIDDKKGLAEVYYLLAQNSLNAWDLDGALENLEKCDSWAKQTQARQQLVDNLRLYAEIYKKRGDIEKENEYLLEYSHFRDSLFQDVVIRNLGLVPLKIKEEQDRFKLSQQQLEIRDQALTNQLFTVIIIITVPLLIIMVILFRKNSRKNQELIKKNEEIQNTQKLLITSEKMASLGVLAAGVGHEINNPLNFIKNGIEALSKKLENVDTTELRPLFEIVNEGVDRATNIVKSLSHFSRRGHSMKEQCSINEIIENCLLILHNSIRDRVRIVTSFTKDGTLQGNEGRLHQVMMNIIANASQAIGDHGTIEITTERKEGFMEIIIEDDGEGILEENLSKINDPFFTTKAPGEGTGLGLFITLSIIEEHDGNIEVKSTPGVGTAFTIKLPLER